MLLNASLYLGRTVEFIGCLCVVAGMYYLDITKDNKDLRNNESVEALRKEVEKIKNQIALKTL